LVVASLGAGCAAGGDTAAARQEQDAPAAAKGYGYEFLTDAVSANAPASRAPSDVGPDRIAPETIQAVVRASFPRLLACSEASGARAAALRGDVTLSFRIGVDGRVSDARADGSTLGDAAVEQCVTSVASSLAFPKSPAGVVTVVYPLMFGR
jgi:hypothetical protein